MPAHEYQEKIDVLDMIISILKEHEENLSGLVDRFDAECNSLASVDEKLSVLEQFLNRLEVSNVKNVIGVPGTKGSLVAVECRDWLTFRGASQGSLLVAFEIADDLLRLSSVTDLFVFTYSEKLPDFEMMNKVTEGNAKFRFGKTNVEASSSGAGGSAYGMILKQEKVKRWLASELGVSEEKIVEGKVIR